jgi:hypothetical protein
METAREKESAMFYRLKIQEGKKERYTAMTHNTCAVTAEAATEQKEGARVFLQTIIREEWTDIKQFKDGRWTDV